ncbi:gag-pol polyprotein [Plasmopara halstedii]|uniref:Gag-pol polyprotein n=1 Tax=Plasmopara halstedii TaxID=4781 RepID=A0A0P1B510_PLAHL|nr:gag-pol polyprotein [Plasmopara halstedii]CEG49116.1 gag-pol polyprotein [Plasmopara halstedii]|eukprot:XP_024585485.1 gag-pol polyprotein [Plasmopara halstedii]
MLCVKVAKYCERYDKSHLVAAKRILKYLTTTMNYGIYLDGSNKRGLLDTLMRVRLLIFTQGDRQQHIYSSVVLWKSKCRPTVATSSTETEHMSLYSATQEMVWLRQLLKDLEYQVNVPTTIYKDNQGCIALAKNPVYHTRTKHVDIKYYSSERRSMSNELSIEYKPTEEMVADAMTKALPRAKHEAFVKAVNMKSTSRIEHAQHGRVFKGVMAQLVWRTLLMVDYSHV